MSQVKGEVAHDEHEDRQAQERRLAALAQIRQYGDAALRMRAKDVETFDEDLARLVERMTSLMTGANGVGLAGNQVGVLQRVVVIQPDREQPAIALVNPRIAERSDETAIDDEGCLSLQGILVPVERSVGVTVEAEDPGGKAMRLEFQELAARVVQHELDHLDGVLILDRTAPAARRDALAVLRPRAVLGVRP